MFYTNLCSIASGLLEHAFISITKKTIMKKTPLISIAFAFGVLPLCAQKPSCDIAYRFDAGYIKTFNQLESLNIFLNHPKPSKETSGTEKSGTTGKYYYVSGAAST